jgi:hypothetical protein
MIIILLGFLASMVWYYFALFYLLRYKNKINELLNKKFAIIYFINATILLLVAILYVYTRNGYIYLIDLILSLLILFYQVYKLKRI